MRRLAPRSRSSRPASCSPPAAATTTTCDTTAADVDDHGSADRRRRGTTGGAGRTGDAERTGGAGRDVRRRQDARPTACSRSPPASRRSRRTSSTTTPEDGPGLRGRRRAGRRRRDGLRPATPSPGSAPRSTRRSRPGRRTSTSTSSSSRSPPSAGEVVDFSDAVLHQQPGDRRATPTRPAEGVTTLADLKDLKFGVAAGTTSLDVRQRRHPARPTSRSSSTTTPARSRRSRPTRSTRSSSTCRRRCTSRPSRSRARRSFGQFPPSAGGTADECGLLFEKDSPLDRRASTWRSPRSPTPASSTGSPTSGWATTPTRPSSSSAERPPATRLTDAGVSRPPDAGAQRRSTGASVGGRIAIADGSTIVVVGGGRARAPRSPGWQKVHSGRSSTATRSPTSFPELLGAFWLDVQIFLWCAPCILVVGAADRAGPQRRAARRCSRCGCSATLYTDVVRGVPVILWIYLIGFGVPGLLASTRDVGAVEPRHLGLGRAGRSPTRRTWPRCSAPGSRASTRASAPAARSLGLSQRPDDALTSCCRRRSGASCRR